MDSLCMHSLSEGPWDNADMCPSCEFSGHISPWQVSKCPACNEDFMQKMDRLKKDIDERQSDKLSQVLSHLQSRIRRLEDKVQQLERDAFNFQKVG